MLNLTPRVAFLAALFILTASSFPAHAQTVLLDPLLDGGFESGSSFSANGWQTANAATNKWFVGNGAAPYHGNRCAYIDNGTGATNTYTVTTAQTSHIYRDITFPANEPRIVLSFKWKGMGQSNTDLLRVFGISTAVTPAAGISTYSGATSFAVASGQAAWQTQTVTLPASYAGTTQRIVFMWTNNAADGTQGPAAVDSVSVMSYPYGNSVSLSKSGSWNDPAMWVNGLVPTTNDTAILSSGANLYATGIPAIPAIRIESGATLQCAGSVSVKKLTLQAGAVFQGFYNNQGVLLNVSGDIINNGLINLAHANASLNFDATAPQQVSGSGAFYNQLIPTLVTNNTSPVSFSQDIKISTQLRLRGNLEGSGSVTLGDASVSKIFTFIGLGGRIALTKPVTGNFNQVTAANYSYSPVSSTFETGNELSATGDSINLTVNSLNGFNLRLGTHVSLNNLTLNDTLDVGNYTLTLNGLLSSANPVFHIRGAGGFTNANRSLIRILSQQGITKLAAQGPVQTTTRNYNPNASYYYQFNGGVTGDGLPDTLTGGMVVIGGPNITLSKPTVFNDLHLVLPLTVQAHNVRINGTGTFNNGVFISGSSSFSTGNSSRLVLTQQQPVTFIESSGIGGSIRITGGITINPGTDISLSGSASLGSGFPLTGIDTLTINSNITITRPLTVNTLTIEGNSKVITTAGNPLVVNKHVVQKVNGFVVGTLTRRIDSLQAGNILFPVAYDQLTERSFQISNPEVNGSHVYMSVSVDPGPVGATAGQGLNAVRTDLVWKLKTEGPGTLQSAEFIKVKHNLASGFEGYTQLGFYKGNTSTGTYKSIGGYANAITKTILTANADSINNLAGDTSYFVLASGVNTSVFNAGTYSIGNTGTYRNITKALIAISEKNSMGGHVILELLPDYDPGKEIYPVVFTGALKTSAGATLTLRPASSVTGVITLSDPAKAASYIIDFDDNSRYVTIDGRPGGTGQSRYLEIEQTRINVPAIRMVNAAHYHTLRRLKISALNGGPAEPGIICMTGSYTDTEKGNNYNTIDYCLIDGKANAASYTANGASSSHGIYSELMNTGNVITNNEIFDCYSPAVTSAAAIVVGNGQKWAIGRINEGNKFYYTQPLTAFSIPRLSSGAVINSIAYNSSYEGDTSLIEGNEIGTIPAITSSVFYIGDTTGVLDIQPRVSVIAATAQLNSYIQVRNNVLSGITHVSGGQTGSLYMFYGISTIGLADYTIENNVIGSLSNNGSIRCYYSKNVNTININAIHAGGVKMDVLNNRVGGFEVRAVANSTINATVNANMIFCSQSIVGSQTNVFGNVIGSSIPHSIYASPSASLVFLNGISMSGSADKVTVAENKVTNLTNLAQGFSQLNGIQSGIMGSLIKNNEISRLKSASSMLYPNAGVAGISISSLGSADVIENNHIHSIENSSLAGGTVNGIVINGSANSRYWINRNKIHSLSSDPLTTSIVHTGINIQNGRPLITNNVVRLGLYANGNSITQPLTMYGIGKQAGATIMHNTLYIGGQNVANGSNRTALIYTATTATDSIANNILLNNRSGITPGGTFHQVMSSPAYPSYIKNNIYYANGNGSYFASIGSADLGNIHEWKNKVLTDTNSVFADPMLVNPSGDTSVMNLGLLPGTPAEANGTALLTVETDKNGNLRSGLTPVDIGAYAVNTTKKDVNAPVITFIAAHNTHLRSNRVLTATITDETGVAVSGADVPRIYYKKNASGTYASTAGTIAGGNGKNGTWNFTVDTSLIGGLNFNDSIYYFFAAQDTSSYANTGTYPLFGVAHQVNNVTSQPPSTFNYKVFEGVSGNYLVGASQTAPNFTTITAAKNFLNGRLVTDDVNFLLQADYSSAAEPAFPIVLTKFYSHNDSNTVTIKPDAGVNAVISGSSATAVIKLENASYYRINGSNNNSNSRNLVINNTSATTQTAGVWLAGNMPLLGGSSFNAVSNCIIYSSINQPSFPATLTYGIIASGTNIAEVAGYNNNNEFHGNYIYKVSIGVLLHGDNNFNRITENLIGSPQIGTDGIGGFGIKTSGQKNLLLEKNEIRSVGDLVSSPIGTMPLGISVIECKRMVMRQNKVHDIISERGTPGVGIQIFGSTVATDTSSNLICNNLVYNVRGRLQGTVGIRIGNGMNDKFLNNTIYLSDSMNFGCIAAVLSDEKRPVVYNNVFAVNTTTRLSYRSTIFISNNTDWSQGLFDYNSFYRNPGNNTIDFANINPVSTAQDLNGLRAVTGQNAHSIDSNPYLNRNGMPDVNSPLLGSGIVQAEVTVDVDDNTRNNPPNIGAYEFSIDSLAPEIFFTPLRLTDNTGNQVITATIKDNTGVPLSGANVPRIHFKKMSSGSWFSTPGVLSAGTTRNGIWNFTIDVSLLGGLIFNDSVYYFISAQDQSPAVNFGTSPEKGGGTSVHNATNTYFHHYRILNSVSGNYLVGASQVSPNFTTLNQAMSFLDGKLVKGNINLLLQSDYNSSSESAFPILLKPFLQNIAGQYTITIKPDAGVNDTIIGTGNSVINIENGAYYVIDGSNNGSSSRNLTVVAHGGISGRSAITLYSMGAGKGSKHNVIRNLNITSTDDLATNDLLKTGIALTGTANDSNVIEGNYIANVAYGIMTVITPPSVQNVGNIYRKNIIGGNSPVTERISLTGVYLAFESFAEISDNEIRHVGKKLSYSTNGDAAGISLVTVQNSKVSGNRIHDVINEKGYSALGIQIFGSSAFNRVSNNLIYRVLGNSNVGGKITAGLLLTNSTNDSFLFNTISMQGDLDSPGLATASIPAFGIMITAANHPVFRNNFIYTSFSSNATTLFHGAISIPSSSFSWGTGSSDYNAIFYDPSNTKMRFGRYGTASNTFTPAQWQSTTTQDAHSYFGDPLVNVYDNTKTSLQLESPLVGAGIAMAGIQHDLLNAARRNPPTIGAYEYPVDQTGPSITYTQIPNSKELNALALPGFATIKDTAGVNVTPGLRPRIYFKKTTEADVFGANNSSANGWKWVEASNTVSPFSFTINYSLLASALEAGDTIAYFVVAQDQSAGNYTSAYPMQGFEGTSVANIIKAPTTPGRLLIIGFPMHGNYNIGALQTRPNYTTITHALGDLWLRGVDGPVTLTLLDTLYSTAETFPLPARVVEGASAVNNITMRPASGVNTRILAATGASTIQFNNCSYFTIDGRQNSIGNTQALKIINTSTSATSVINLINDSRNNNFLYTDVMGALSPSNGVAVIYFANTVYPYGSDSNTIRNCDIHSHSATATPNAGISIFSTSTFTEDQCSDYITIDSCRIYDYSGTSFASTGIHSGKSKGLRITNNRFYQTATRNFGLTVLSEPHEHRAIWYDNPFQPFSTPDSVLISGNFIGSNGAGGDYTITGDHQFSGIEVYAARNTKVSVQGNTIARLSISTKTPLVDAAAVGMSISGDSLWIGDQVPNVIGSLTANGSISFTTTVNNAGFTGIIAAPGSGGYAKVTNNKVSGINLASASASVGASFNGIILSGYGGLLKNNVVGSETLLNSINQLSTAASNAQHMRMRGLVTYGNVLTDSNIIANINSNSTCQIGNVSYELDVTGILCNGSTGTISNNRIFNLSSSTLTQNTFKGNINGIMMVAGNVTIENNEIFALRYTNATTPSNYVQVCGINLLSTATARVNANRIHSFSANNSHSGFLLTLAGIYSYGRSTTISNNMIRLGIDENGNSVTTPCGIWGMVIRNDDGIYLNKILNNSVYLGGVSMGAGHSNTITRAFTHLNNSKVIADTIVNNIFSNMRSNSGTGVKNYTIYMYDYKNAYLNRNVYQKTASGVFGTANYMTWDTLDYKAGWVASDNESVVADPQFVNPTGNAASVDLHIRSNVPTPVEGAGYPLTPETDMDGEQRSGLTPVDIGADAGNFMRQDLLPPVIVYTPFDRDTVAPKRFVSGVSITDASGVDTAFNKRPRLYFKKRTNNNAFVGNTSADNGWKYVVANNISSPFSFTIDYSLLHGGPVVLGDNIDYFITAQDSSPAAYVSANPAYGFKATSVANITSAPASPNSYLVYHLKLNGVYNVGAGQSSPNFPSITAAVARMADVGVSGKVTFNLTDNLYNSSTETFPIVINTINGASAQNTVTLKPGLPGTRIEGNTINSSQLLELNNAAYFKLDGSADGSGSRDLTVDNTGDGRAVFIYNTVTSHLNDTIANTILSGSRNVSSALLISGTTDYMGVVVINNKFQASLNGVKVEGSRARGGLRIINNVFGDSLPENSLHTAGINSVGAEGIHIIGNKVTNVKNQAGTTTYGIYASTLGGQVIGNTVENISDTGTYFSPNAYGIYVPGALYMMNNFVSGITGDYATGILGGTFAVHNTVNMYSRRGNALNTYTQSVALAAGGTVKNNILINSTASANPSSNTSNYLLLSSVPATSLELGYNNYYNAPVSNTQTFIGYTASTFTDWKALTNDSTSRNVPVTFVSPKDLHLAGTSVGDTNLKAPPQPWYTETDIDGDLRNTFFTYMGADENTGSPVPVKLLQFTATRKAADVELNWATASEKNNYGFDVERSRDGKRFEKIGFVKGTTASGVRNKYQTIDEQAFLKAQSNTIYYRLKQLDVDGKYTYSNVAIVTNPVSKALVVSAYPNPFSNTVKIRFTHDAENEGTIELRDLNGKLLYSAKSQLKAGDNELETADLSSLQSGMYFMSIVTPAKTSVIKVIKQ